TNPPGTFYSDPGCSTLVSGVVVPGGTSSASFYFKAYNTGNLTASASGLSSGNQLETVAAGAPVKLAFSTLPQAVQINLCSAVTSIQSQDTYGNPSAVSAPTVVSLSSSLAAVTFFKDACITPTTATTIGAGSFGA